MTIRRNLSTRVTAQITLLTTSCLLLALTAVHMLGLNIFGLAALAILLMLTTWLIRYSVQRMLAPIATLTDQIARLPHKHGAERLLHIEDRDEIGAVAQVFNAMLQELDEKAVANELQTQTCRFMAEFAIEMSAWRTTDGAIRFISPNCQELTGYQDTEFYAAPGLLDCLIHPDDRDSWHSHHHKYDKQDSHPPFLIRLICKDGTIRWMRHTCHLTRDAAGTVTGQWGNFSDVTAVVAVQQTLDHEKRFIENLLNGAATPLFVIDRRHRVIYWNRALEIVTGLSQAEMLGTDRHWSGFYHEKRLTLADLVVEGKTKLHGLYLQYTPSKYLLGGYQAEGWFELSGSRRYLVFEAAPIRDAGGEIVAAIETLEDITERQTMEESVRRLTQAVEQSSSVILITGIDGAIEYVNPRFYETTGYNAAEVLGKNPRLIKSGEMKPEGYAALWKTISSGESWRGEFHNRRKDGELYWESATISPLFDKQGVITGYLAVKEDITEQKAAREQLSQYRDQLEAKHLELEAAFKRIELAKHEWEETLDQLRDFIILTDTNHRIRRYNKILANQTGYGVTELHGRDWRELLKETGFTFVSFDATRGELLHQRSGRTYDIYVYPIRHNDIATGLVVSLNDTTELRITSQELEKAIEGLKDAQLQIFQQEKMASIGQLAAGVAHEINNPMGFISSNLGTLEKYINRLSEFFDVIGQAMATGSASETAEQVQNARMRLKIDRIMDDAHQLIAESQDGAGRVRRIVQDLKSFSRVDQAETALINLNETLETTINIAWNEIKYVAELKREFGDIPPIQCFPQQLNQVFLNLLVNAAHALGTTRGEITVRTESAGDSVLVQIRDNGCGIPEELQKRIFEPFFTTKAVGKGTGLGLSISYDIVKKHGGEITLQSEVGFGSTFTVRLPLALPEQTGESV